jgi:formylglycine-generating enzyme
MVASKWSPLVFALACTPVCAQVAAKPSSRPGTNLDKPRLAILDLKLGEGLTTSAGSVLADLVRAKAQQCPRFDLMDRQTMVEIFREQDFDQVACGADTCVSTAGKLLKVQKIVAGQASAFGRVWTLSIRIVDVSTGRVEASVTKIHAGEMEGLLDVAEQAAQQLFSGRDPEPVSKGPALDLGQGVSMEIVPIPAGTFMMGSRQEPSAGDAFIPHEVRFSRGFSLGKTEVTVRQFRRFVDDKGYVTEAERSHRPGGFSGLTAGQGDAHSVWQAGLSWRDPGFPQSDDCPVVMVSWNDAQAFCSWLGDRNRRVVRLPSEAEWEYACRAGAETRYWWGDDLERATRFANVADGSLAAVHPGWSLVRGKDGYPQTAPVGSFSPNRFGLYDTTGNVAEWCEDKLHDHVDGSPRDGSAWTAGRPDAPRVKRGGAWNSPLACLGASHRHSDTPDVRSNFMGFRVACDTVTGDDEAHGTSRIRPE